MDLLASHSCSKTHVHKITNLPVVYMALRLNDFGGGNGKSITSGHEKGWALKNLFFSEPKWHSFFFRSLPF
jgi:hypothetical protein